jgi:hypothetical protein
MVVGCGSSIEAFPLFGLRLEDYDSLFAKLDLLLKIRDNEHVRWSGEYRPTLNGQGVYPRSLQGAFADMGRRWWDSTIIRPCWCAWTPLDGCNHRRRNTQGSGHSSISTGRLGGEPAIYPIN